MDNSRNRVYQRNVLNETGPPALAPITQIIQQGGGSSESLRVFFVFSESELSEIYTTGTLRTTAVPNSSILALVNLPGAEWRVNRFGNYDAGELCQYDNTGSSILETFIPIATLAPNLETLVDVDLKTNQGNLQTRHLTLPVYNGQIAFDGDDHTFLIRISKDMYPVETKYASSTLASILSFADYVPPTNEQKNILFETNGGGQWLRLPAVDLVPETPLIWKFSSVSERTRALTHTGYSVDEAAALDDTLKHGHFARFTSLTGTNSEGYTVYQPWKFLYKLKGKAGQWVDFIPEVPIELPGATSVANLATTSSNTPAKNSLNRLGQIVVDRAKHQTKICVNGGNKEFLIIGDTAYLATLTCADESAWTTLKTSTTKTAPMYMVFVAGAIDHTYLLYPTNPSYDGTGNLEPYVTCSTLRITNEVSLPFFTSCDDEAHLSDVASSFGLVSGTPGGRAFCYVHDNKHTYEFVYGDWVVRTFDSTVAQISDFRAGVGANVDAIAPLSWDSDNNVMSLDRSQLMFAQPPIYIGAAFDGRPLLYADIQPSDVAGLDNHVFNLFHSSSDPYLTYDNYGSFALNLSAIFNYLVANGINNSGGSGSGGSTGPMGPMGPMGPAGATGGTGAKGETGAKGDKGEKGEKGPKGDQGEKGAKGDAGPTSVSACMGIVGPRIVAPNDQPVRVSYDASLFKVTVDTTLKAFSPLVHDWSDKANCRLTLPYINYWIGRKIDSSQMFLAYPKERWEAAQTESVVSAYSQLHGTYPVDAETTTFNKANWNPALTEWHASDETYPTIGLICDSYSRDSPSDKADEAWPLAQALSGIAVLNRGSFQGLFTGMLSGFTDGNDIFDCDEISAGDKSSGKYDNTIVWHRGTDRFYKLTHFHAAVAFLCDAYIGILFSPQWVTDVLSFSAGAYYCERVNPPIAPGSYFRIKDEQTYYQKTSTYEMRTPGVDGGDEYHKENKPNRSTRYYGWDLIPSDQLHLHHIRNTQYVQENPLITEKFDVFPPEYRPNRYFTEPRAIRALCAGSGITYNRGDGKTRGDMYTSWGDRTVGKIRINADTQRGLNFWGTLEFDTNLSPSNEHMPKTTKALYWEPRCEYARRAMMMTLRETHQRNFPDIGDQSRKTVEGVTTAMPNPVLNLNQSFGDWVQSQFKGKPVEIGAIHWLMSYVLQTPEKTDPNWFALAQRSPLVYKNVYNYIDDYFHKDDFHWIQEANHVVKLRVQFVKMVDTWFSTNDFVWKMENNSTKLRVKFPDIPPTGTDTTPNTGEETGGPEPPSTDQQSEPDYSWAYNIANYIRRYTFDSLKDLEDVDGELLDYLRRILAVPVTVVNRDICDYYGPLLLKTQEGIEIDPVVLKKLLIRGLQFQFPIAQTDSSVRLVLSPSHRNLLSVENTGLMCSMQRVLDVLLDALQTDQFLDLLQQQLRPWVTSIVSNPMTLPNGETLAFEHPLKRSEQSIRILVDPSPLNQLNVTKKGLYVGPQNLRRILMALLQDDPFVTQTLEDALSILLPKLLTSLPLTLNPDPLTTTEKITASAGLVRVEDDIHPLLWANANNLLVLKDDGTSLGVDQTVIVDLITTNGPTVTASTGLQKVSSDIRVNLWNGSGAGVDTHSGNNLLSLQNSGTTLAVRKDDIVALITGTITTSDVYTVSAPLSKSSFNISLNQGRGLTLDGDGKLTVRLSPLLDNLLSFDGQGVYCGTEKVQDLVTSSLLALSSNAAFLDSLLQLLFDNRKFLTEIVQETDQRQSMSSLRLARGLRLTSNSALEIALLLAPDNLLEFENSQLVCRSDRVRDLTLETIETLLQDQTFLDTLFQQLMQDNRSQNFFNAITNILDPFTLTNALLLGRGLHLSRTGFLEVFLSSDPSNLLTFDNQRLSLPASVVEQLVKDINQTSQLVVANNTEQIALLFDQLNQQLRVLRFLSGVQDITSVNIFTLAEQLVHRLEHLEYIVNGGYDVILDANGDYQYIEVYVLDADGNQIPAKTLDGTADLYIDGVLQYQKRNVVLTTQYTTKIFAKGHEGRIADLENAVRTTLPNLISGVRSDLTSMFTNMNTITENVYPRIQALELLPARVTTLEAQVPRITALETWQSSATATLTSHTNHLADLDLVLVGGVGSHSSNFFESSSFPSLYPNNPILPLAKTIDVFPSSSGYAGIHLRLYGYTSETLRLRSIDPVSISPYAYNDLDYGNGGSTYGSGLTFNRNDTQGCSGLWYAQNYNVYSYGTNAYGDTAGLPASGNYVTNARPGIQVHLHAGYGLRHTTHGIEIVPSEVQTLVAAATGAFDPNTIAGQVASIWLLNPPTVLNNMLNRLSALEMRQKVVITSTILICDSVHKTAQRELKYCFQASRNMGTLITPLYTGAWGRYFPYNPEHFENIDGNSVNVMMNQGDYWFSCARALGEVPTGALVLPLNAYPENDYGLRVDTYEYCNVFMYRINARNAHLERVPMTGFIGPVGDFRLRFADLAQVDSVMWIEGYNTVTKFFWWVVGAVLAAFSIFVFGAIMKKVLGWPNNDTDNPDDTTVQRTRVTFGGQCSIPQFIMPPHLQDGGYYTVQLTFRVAMQPHTSNDPIRGPPWNTEPALEQSVATQNFCGIRIYIGQTKLRCTGGFPAPYPTNNAIDFISAPVLAGFRDYGVSLHNTGFATEVQHSVDVVIRHNDYVHLYFENLGRWDMLVTYCKVTARILGPVY